MKFSTIALFVISAASSVCAQEEIEMAADLVVLPQNEVTQLLESAESIEKFKKAIHASPTDDTTAFAMDGITSSDVIEMALKIVAVMSPDEDSPQIDRSAGDDVSGEHPLPKIIPTTTATTGGATATDDIIVDHPLPKIIPTTTASTGGATDDIIVDHPLPKIIPTTTATTSGATATDDILIEHPLPKIIPTTTASTGGATDDIIVDHPLPKIIPTTTASTGGTTDDIIVDHPLPKIIPTTTASDPLTETDQSPILLEITDEGSVAEPAPGEAGAVELPDDEQMMMQSEEINQAEWEVITEDGVVGKRNLRVQNGRHLALTAVNSTEWLTAHNTRRTQLYKDNALGPKDLVWSKGIQAKAESYLQILLAKEKCTIQHNLDDWEGGENLAAAWSSRVGKVRTPTDAVKAWYEGEQAKPFGSNGHYTAVGWRATKYLGCASGTKLYNGGQCFVEVCRYVKPGNCNILADSWQKSMLAEDSPCGDECPPEGCSATTSASSGTWVEVKATTSSNTQTAINTNAPDIVAPPEAQEWILAHNSRRTALYAANNLGPMDLKWSPKTAEAADSYLKLLLSKDGCAIQHKLDAWKGGENLAAAQSSTKGYGRTKTDAVKAWYEGEQAKPFGQNGHFSAVGWRATKYFGCANGKKDFNGGECFMEVCRYVKPGNCNVDASNWKARMLADTSTCGDECPAEGCF